MKQICAIWTSDDEVLTCLRDSEEEATAWKDGVADCCHAIGGVSDDVGYIAVPMNADEADNRADWLWPPVQIRKKIAAYAATVGIALPEAFANPQEPAP